MLERHTEHSGKANEHQVQEEMDCWNVMEYSDKAMPETKDRWNVVEHSGTANCCQDAEANVSWKDVECVGAKKGLRMHRGIQRAIDNWKIKKQSAGKASVPE